MKRIPKTIEDFAWVSWTAEEIEKKTEDILIQKKAAYSRIKSIPAAERTFENTIFNMEKTGDIMTPVNYFEILANTSTDAAVREAANEAIKKIQKESVDIEYDEDMYRAFKEYADKDPQLKGEDWKLFDNTRKDYKRMGFHLSPEVREAVKANAKRRRHLGNEFELNLREYRDQILVSRDELEGLPLHYVEGLRQDESGNYIVSLDYPEFGPFIENATNSAKKKELFDKFLKKGGQKNLDIAKELLELRKQTAILLGYPTHADYVTELRMAKTPQTVEKFLSEFMDRLQPGTDHDYEELVEYKRKKENDPAAKLEYFETAFYAGHLEKERFQFDPEKVREYFPLQHVLDQMFQIFGTLFNISFKESNIYLWHSDVKLFEVIDAEGILGYLFFDLFPRENKFSHAACFGIHYGHRPEFKGEEYITPFTGMVANFNKPVNGRPSLLSHSEVETMFHEFGHVLHNLFNQTAYVSTSAVAWDFVEVPSQILEYWVWDKELIKSLSKHYETGESLPEEIINNMVRAKYSFISWSLMGQVIYSWFDISVHAHDWPDNLSAFLNELVAKHKHLNYPKENLFPAGFGHFVGYDAGYYSYLWSKIICADFFHGFKQEGLLNPKVGQEYRNKVLAVGSSRDEMETVKDFLGREPNNEAFLEEIGLKK